jgi:hypothetical protein
MPRFTEDNTLGYEPAGIKLLNKIFDKVTEALRSRADGSGPSEPGAASRDDKIAQTVLDVCYEDHGNIDAADLARQVLTRLGYGDGAPGKVLPARA